MYIQRLSDELKTKRKDADSKTETKLSEKTTKIKTTDRVHEQNVN